MSPHENGPSTDGVAGRVLPWLPAAVLLVSVDGIIRWHNPAAGRAFGDRNRSLVGLSVLDRCVAGDNGVVAAFLRRIAEAAPDESVHAEVRFVRFDGSVRNVELCGANLLGDASVEAIVLHLADVTQYVRVAEDANRDALTGLPNRAAFHGALGAAWRRLAAGSGGPITVIFCDLDRFKLINDRYGHAAGDTVLTEVAGRLSAVLADRGAVARIGGDEFVVLLDSDLGWERACQDLLAAIEAPLLIEGQTIRVSASLGVARATSPEGGPHRVLREADTAMYAAKESGRGRWHLFDGSVRDPAALAAIAALEGELRRDYLTGVGNPRALDEHLERLHAEARRTASPYVVAFVDGDSFGHINKQYGQDVGDAVVRAMAQTLIHEVRAGDMVFRRGGDEFVVVLRETTVQGARDWLDRVRRTIAQGLDGQVPVFAVSAGVADFDPEQDGVGPRDVMARAERAMLEAKSAGGNRVVAA